MQFNADVMDIWARRVEAEEFVRSLLSALSAESEQIARSVLSDGPADATTARMLMSGKSKSQPIVAWKTQPHVNYAIPAEAGESRFRIQVQLREGRSARPGTSSARCGDDLERILDAAVAEQQLLEAQDVIPRKGRVRTLRVAPLPDLDDGCAAVVEGSAA